MTSREDLVDLITSTAVDALDWHWEARPPYVLSPEDCFRHVAEAIADVVEPAVAEQALRDVVAEMRQMMTTFKHGGQWTRAGWAINWAEYRADKIAGIQR